MRPVVLLAASFALGFAPAPFPKTPREADRSAADLRAIQGDWLVTVYKVHGSNVPTYGTTTVSITGDRFRWLQRGQLPKDYMVRLAAGRSPTLDFVEHGTNKVFFGIYKIEGGALTVCTTEPEVGRRPETFDGSRRGYELMVLKRGVR
jgi:uncharacterized protein (TIGR03067 family)